MEIAVTTADRLLAKAHVTTNDSKPHWDLGRIIVVRTSAETLIRERYVAGEVQALTQEYLAGTTTSMISGEAVSAAPTEA